jgi:hypothetical protein
MKLLIGLSMLVSALSPLPLSGQAKWEPSTLTPGLSYMPLLGERTKPGPYVYRVRAPDGFRIPPHWHSQAMHLTVLTGTFIMVMGEPLDSSRAQRYGGESFVVVPARMRHAEWFEGETVVHVKTEGPLETVFLNPGDDPRSRPRP